MLIVALFSVAVVGLPKAQAASSNIISQVLVASPTKKPDSNAPSIHSDTLVSVVLPSLPPKLPPCHIVIVVAFVGLFKAINNPAVLVEAVTSTQNSPIAPTPEAATVVGVGAVVKVIGKISRDPATFGSQVPSASTAVPDAASEITSVKVSAQQGPTL